jgi:hypothetical protein
VQRGRTPIHGGMYREIQQHGEDAQQSNRKHERRRGSIRARKLFAIQRRRVDGRTGSAAARWTRCESSEHGQKERWTAITECVREIQEAVRTTVQSDSGFIHNSQWLIGLHRSLLDICDRPNNTELTLFDGFHVKRTSESLAVTFAPTIHCGRGLCHF